MTIVDVDEAGTGTVIDLGDRRPPAAESPTDWATVSSEERQAAALGVAAAAIAAGKKLSGAELGRQFGMSERWGRGRNTEAEALAGQRSGSRPPASSPAGNRQPSARQDGSRQPVPGSPAAHTTGSGTALPSPAAGSRQPAAPGTRPAADRAPRRPAAAGGRQPAARPAAGSSRVDLAILVLVGLIAAAASFGHQFNAALVVGEPVPIALLWPVTVDGLAFVSMRHGNRLWLRIGLAISIATNVVARAPELTEHGLTPLVIAGLAIAAWPPISVYGVHSVYERRRHR